MKSIWKVFQTVMLCAALPLLFSACSGGGGSGGGGGGGGVKNKDTSPPAIQSVSPTDGATDVAVNASVNVVFSENLNCTTAIKSSFFLNSPSGEVNRTVSCLGSSVTVNPASQLAPFTLYNLTVSNAVTDVAGNHLALVQTFNFTTGNTGDTTPPAVSGVNPADNATDVSVGIGVLSAIFTEPMDCTTLNVNTFTLYNGASQVLGTVGCSAGTATFTIGSALGYSTDYTAMVNTGAADLAGNHLGADHIWHFTTEADTYPPTVSTTSPLNSATNVPRDSTISITFSENMNCSTFNTGTFTLYQGTTPITGTVGCSGNMATVTPNTTLDAQKPFTATVSGTVTDTVGNQLGSDYIWNFTTGLSSGTSLWEHMIWDQDKWG